MKNLNVIFVHGWLFDSKIWWGLDNEFNDFKSVYTIDLPGYGENKASKINHVDFYSIRTFPPRHYERIYQPAQ